MQYQLFRLSLIQRRKPPLLEIVEGPPPAIFREGYLQAVFGQRIDFALCSQAYACVHIETIDAPVVGRLGRQGVEHPTGPPETGFAREDMSVHFAVNLLVDTAGDPDGQKLASQINPRVGSPRQIAEALVQRINEIGVDAAWKIDINPTTDVGTFWNGVKKHGIYSPPINFGVFRESFGWF